MKKRHGKSCRDENHGQKGHVCSHLKELGNKESLYPYLDLDKLECLNEHEDDAAKGCFKPVFGTYMCRK